MQCNWTRKWQQGKLKQMRYRIVGLTILGKGSRFILISRVLLIYFDEYLKVESFSIEKFESYAFSNFSIFNVE